MAFSNSNIYTSKTIQNLKSPCYWLIPISYWPVFGINQVVDCIVRLTFVLTVCSTTKPSSLISHIVNLLHGGYPRARSFFATLVAICHSQTCYNLLKQLAASLRITRFDNQLATSLLTDTLQQNFTSRANSSWYVLVDQICCEMSTEFL